MSGLMKWPGSRRHKAPGEWVKYATDKELDVLMGLTDLSKLGSLPSDAASLYQEIQARAEVNMERSQTTLALPAPDNVTVPHNMTFGDILRIRWRSADSKVRQALRAVAAALGVSAPMSRTRNSSVGGKDSMQARRLDSDQHLTHDEPEPLESASEEEEAEEPHYHDPPEWHDELADGWEPCSDLHQALHPVDRGWY